jgi:FkbM family methyltransferase
MKKKSKNKINYKYFIYNFIIKLITYLVPYRIFYNIQKISLYCQGKGYVPYYIGDEIRSCKKLLGNREIKVIFDIGANEGRYTEQLLKYFSKANYYLFEPNKLNYRKLKLKFFNLPNINIINKALSDENKNDFLYLDKPKSVLASLIKRRMDHFNTNFNIKKKINIIRLDNFIKSLNKKTIIDYCKIDAEGSEMKIINGMGNFIKRIKLIQFEFGGSSIDFKTFFQDYWYYFKSHNFDIFRITPVGPKLINSYKESDEIFLTTNYIALNRGI